MGALLAYVSRLWRLRLFWRSYPALTGWAKFWHASGVFRGGKENVKTRTLENRKGTAPKFVLALHGCAARLCDRVEWDFVCCHGPSAPWPTFARRERKRKSAIPVASASLRAGGMTARKSKRGPGEPGPYRWKCGEEVRIQKSVTRCASF